jgi:hypothetical protein
VTSCRHNLVSYSIWKREAQSKLESTCNMRYLIMLGCTCGLYRLAAKRPFSSITGASFLNQRILVGGGSPVASHFNFTDSPASLVKLPSTFRNRSEPAQLGSNTSYNIKVTFILTENIRSICRRCKTWLQKMEKVDSNWACEKRLSQNIGT